MESVVALRVCAPQRCCRTASWWIEGVLRMTSLSPAPRAPDDALPLRWLADACGLPPVALVPSLASTLLARPDTARRAADYVAWWIRHPDPGSSFERATRHLIDQPDDSLINTLRGMNYDGLLYRQDGKIVWHAFFQRHGT